MALLAHYLGIQKTALLSRNLSDSQDSATSRTTPKQK